MPGVVLLGAVVLTGGTGARLGGVDKAELEVGGRSLLDRALAAVTGVVDPARLVVVGDPRPGVRSVREQPPGGGPAAGLLAGVEALPAEVERVLALAVDMPMVTSGTLTRLLDAVPDGHDAPDGAILVDAVGRRQYLCAVYDRAKVIAAAPHRADGLSLRSLVDSFALAEVVAGDRETFDVDTPAHLAQVRRWLSR